MTEDHTSTRKRAAIDRVIAFLRDEVHHPNPYCRAAYHGALAYAEGARNDEHANGLEVARTAWQLIETAPKDTDKWILACGPKIGPLLVHWADEDKGNTWISDTHELCFSLTHWMPLPLPPVLS